MDEPKWTLSYDRDCVAWPKYLAASKGDEGRTRQQWLIYREGYAQGQRDAATGENEYPLHLTNRPPEEG